MTRKVLRGDPSLAVAYLRASKDEQKLSPEAQRTAIEAWAVRERVTVISWHVEHLSSVTPIAERPAFLDALNVLREHGAGILVCAKRDRLARDVVVGAMLGQAVHAAGAVVVSAMGEGNGDSPADAMMRGIVDVFAAYERDMIKARTRAALQAKKAKGERVGGVPYGFRVEAGRLIADEREAIVVALARDLAPCMSQRAIAAELTAQGHLSRTGRPFLAAQIARMIAGYTGHIAGKRAA